MSIERYKTVATKILSAEKVEIKTTIPKPTDTDYTVGYIKRYFIQRVNDKSSPIFEVSSKQFSLFSTNPLYKGTSIKWRLVGLKEEVMFSNKKSIDIGSKKISNLKLYLPNLLQFHK